MGGGGRRRRQRLGALVAPGAALALLSLTACDPHFFHADGFVASDGGGLGRWSATPQGCSRAPTQRFAAPVEASFFWEDPSSRDARLRENWGMDAPDAPLRLDIVGSAPRTARLQTVKTPGTVLDGSDCARLELRATEQAPAYAGGRPTLRGTLLLDCRVRGSHVTAEVRFAYCEF